MTCYKKRFFLLHPFSPLFVSRFFPLLGFISSPSPIVITTGIKPGIKSGLPYPHLSAAMYVSLSLFVLFSSLFFLFHISSPTYPQPCMYASLAITLISVDIVYLDIDGYWSILVDTGGCFSSPTYPQPCRPLWRRRSCCKPDIEGRRGERSNPSWEFWKKCFDYTSWSYCFYSAFISELMLYFILRPLSIHSDPYQGLITCLSFQKINAFDTQRKIWRWMYLRVMRLVRYSVSDWCSSWRVSAGMNECRLLRHLNSFKCCWFNIFYQTHTSVRWLKGTKNYQQVSLNSFIQFLFTGWWKGEHYHEINRTMVSLPSCLNLECYILWGTALAAINSARNSFGALCNTSMHWSKNTLKCRGLLMLHRWCNIEMSQFETAKELRGQWSYLIFVTNPTNIFV